MAKSQAGPDTTPIHPIDASAGFSCGVRALDDYFARHAHANDLAGIGRAYVLRRGHDDAVDLPPILGFYTLSMASVEPTLVAKIVTRRLPRYPLPVALIGRLAVDRRAHGRRFGERLLVDAMRRILAAADEVGCIGVIVDAKNDSAVRFYTKYDFACLVDEGWPRRMYLPMETMRAAFARG